MDTVTDVLEIVYFLSGPALAVIAFLALEQIKIAKSQINEQREISRIHAKRDSLRATADQISVYGKEIIPLSNILNDKIRSSGTEFFEKSEMTIDNEEISVKPYFHDGEAEKVKSFVPEYGDYTNALDAFAAFFLSGVADESYAYKGLASTYCNSVKDI